MPSVEGRAGVLVVGEALVDVVRRPGQADVTHAGGSPFNVAVGLGRLGVGVELGAQIGDDEHGSLLTSQLERAGVALANLAPTPSRTSSAVADIGADGSASYTFDLTWDPADAISPAGREAVHVGSLGIALEPGAATVAALVAAAAAQGVVVSLDPNVRLSVEPDHARWREIVDDLLPSVTVLKMSDEDAEVLRPGQDLQELVAELAAPGRVVAITRGGEGAVLGSPAGVVELPGPTVDVADTIGAGDSFMAAMLAWLADRHWPAPTDLALADLAALLRWASIAATITVGRPGADPPWRDELERGAAGS